jgi:hypothetical protein
MKTSTDLTRKAGIEERDCEIEGKNCVRATDYRMRANDEGQNFE